MTICTHGYQADDRQYWREASMGIVQLSAEARDKGPVKVDLFIIWYLTVL